MTTQPEQILENNLVAQLQKLGYKKVVIKNESDLLDNLKNQLEIHNKTRISDGDFKQILNYINKGNVFERAKILRDRVPYTNDQGEHKTIELINQIHWCQNEFQVTQQVEMEGTYKNRYDVTILINGLPLVQIELKRRGLELKEDLTKPTVTNAIPTEQDKVYFNLYKSSSLAMASIQNTTPTAH